MSRTSDAERRLIEAAARLWYTRSFADVGVNEICEAADVRKGSFYHFFASKRDLALAVIDERWEELQSEVIRPALRDDAPPLERLGRLTELGARAVEVRADELGGSYGCPFGNLAVELSTIDEVVRARLQELFEGNVAVLKALLDEAIELGDLPEGIDTELTARAINAFYEGVLAMSKNSGDAGVVRRLGPLAVRLIGAPVPIEAAEA